MRVQELIPTGPFWDQALSVLNAAKRLGYLPNIFNPKTFNEHILARKLKFDGDMALARRVTDKVEVKAWLAELGLHMLIVPTIGVFDSVEEIEAFHFEGEVIAKAAHGSGAAMIRKAENGQAFSQDDLAMFKAWLAEDYYKRGREPNYKGLRRRIIVEPLLRDEAGHPPKDFKFFCVNGRPFAIQVDHDRHSNHTRQIYNIEWELMDFSWCYPRNPEVMGKPDLLENALDVTRTLSDGFGFVSVDLYFMPDGLRLGEMTFFPANGAGQFYPKAADRILGDMLLNAKM